MNFREWRNERVLRYPEQLCSEDLLDHTPFDIVAVNRRLSIFSHETCRSDGEQYPFTTIYQMLGGILCHLCSVDP